MNAVADECVVLLHGMVRTAKSMDAMAAALTEAGYAVANVDYPSRQHPIESLATLAVERGLSACSPGSRVHFVTHSLGGILVRQYLAHHTIENLGRVVMLAPPNQGSQVVDRLGDLPGFGLLNGPAGRQLGTGTDSVPKRLGPVDYEVGVIAGTATINLVLSTLLPGENDGKVTVENTRVEGMRDHLALPHSHPFIMRAPAVHSQTIHFLKTGTFQATSHQRVQANSI